MFHVICAILSGGASYGAKGLKPLQFLLQPLQNFCVKQYIVSTSIFLCTEIKIVVTHRLSYFKAKMHQNRFLLVLRPRPRWGSLERSPDSLAGFEGISNRGEERALLLRKGKGRKGKGREWSYF